MCLAVICAIIIDGCQCYILLCAFGLISIVLEYIFLCIEIPFDIVSVTVGMIVDISHPKFRVRITHIGYTVREEVIRFSIAIAVFPNVYPFCRNSEGNSRT